MYIRFLADTKLFDFLFQRDLELAATFRKQDCPFCGGKLHQGNYRRKPRGGPEGSGPELAVRLSFCCAEENCRRRATPPSLRFLGRRVYFGVVFLLVGVLRHGATPKRVSQLRELIGVSARTLARWRRWWQVAFAASAFWKVAQGTHGLLCAACDLPHALLERFSGEPRSRLLSCLRFFSPISTPSFSGRRTF